MAIVGIQSLNYGVDDVACCTRYFVDFGLPLVSASADEAVFRLQEGSEVRILALDDKRLPESALVGPGVREVVWGVDTEQALVARLDDLGRDRNITIDDEGTAHFLSDCGLPLALRLFEKKTVINAPDPLNAPGVVRRLNTHRKWRTRAQPKTINHVVFAVRDFRASFEFFRDRMGFRMSDYQHHFGIYLRADGSNNHHNLLTINASAPLPGMDGQPRFHHANFGVEDIDELMIGANHMKQRGWPESHVGLGRHRIDSALFFYLPCPAGGEAEYGTDADYVDDAWVPREWPVPLFAYSHWTHNTPAFLAVPPAWEIRYLPDDNLPDPENEKLEH
ncbi:VOC family protein [Paraburkholderia sp.]|uniref:VOC family protein n=1 Tax=Paraburkholderia sp. TaxID=1926495 RepID=UPI003C7A2379